MYAHFTPAHYEVTVPIEFAAFGVGPGEVIFAQDGHVKSFLHKVYMPVGTMIEVYHLIHEAMCNVEGNKPFSFEVKAIAGGNCTSVSLDVDSEKVRFNNERNGERTTLNTAECGSGDIDVLLQEKAFTEDDAGVVLIVEFDPYHKSVDEEQDEINESHFKLSPQEVEDVPASFAPVIPPTAPVYEQPKLRLSILRGTGNGVKTLYLVNNVVEKFGEPVVGYLETSGYGQTLTAFCSLYPNGPRSISDNAKSCLSCIANVLIPHTSEMVRFIRECVGAKGKLVLSKEAVDEIKNEQVRMVLNRLFKDKAVNDVNEKVEALSIRG